MKWTRSKRKRIDEDEDVNEAEIIDAVEEDVIEAEEEPDDEEDDERMSMKSLLQLKRSRSKKTMNMSMKSLLRLKQTRTKRKWNRTRKTPMKSLLQLN